jgi:hypothetical protein
MPPGSTTDRLISPPNPDPQRCELQTCRGWPPSENRRIRREGLSSGISDSKGGRALEKSNHLRPRHRRKARKEFVNRVASLKVLEKCLNRHASTRENWSPTHYIRRSRDHRITHNAYDKLVGCPCPKRPLTMRLSDAGVRCRQTKLIYPNHRPPLWPTEDATRDRSNRLLADGPCPPIAWASRAMSVRQYK